MQDGQSATQAPKEHTFKIGTSTVHFIDPECAMSEALKKIRKTLTAFWNFYSSMTRLMLFVCC